MFSRSAFLLLTAALAWSQTPAPATIEIRGSVIEEGTSAGIGGVHVELSTVGAPEYLNVYTDTDGTGTFVLTLSRDGAWAFRIKKDGYSIGNGDLNLQVKAGPPVQTVRLYMRRMATITGRVEDAETRAAIANAPLFLEQTDSVAAFQYAPGSPRSANTHSDAQGKFTYSGQVGKYVARLMPSVWVDRVLTKFTPEDIEKIDEDFEDSFWPGGFERDAATPIPVTSGATTDLGTIRVRKTKYYRLHIAFPAQGCESGAIYRANITRQPSAPQTSGIWELGYNALCGQDVLIKGLKPGSYRAELTPFDGEPAKQLWSLNRFAITNKNVSLTAALAGGPDLDGRFVAAEGAGSLPSGMRASITHRDWSGPAEVRSAVADKEGRFHLPNVPVDVWNAGMMTPLPPGWVIADIRFRGVSLGRNLGRTLSEFNWDGSGAIEIVLDDKPGSVHGTVMKNDKPAPDTAVLLYPLPLPPGGYLTTYENLATEVKPDGSFAFESLPAGDYRIFAVSPALPSLFRGPSITTAFPAGSEKVTVTRGGSALIDLRLIPDQK